MKLNQFVLLGITSLFASVLSVSGNPVGVLANLSSNSMMLLANSENLTPQPPSLQGKGEPDSPLLLGEGLGEGSDPSSIRQQYHSSSPTSTSTGTKATVAQKLTVAIVSGTFVAGEKPTTGMARIVTENGHRYLELDNAFSTSDLGPDLHVLLDTSEKPPQSYQNPGSYVNLGKLQKYSGAQRYPIPDAINLASFKSAVIWCRMANATFGYATLGSASSANRR